MAAGTAPPLPLTLSHFANKQDVRPRYEQTDWAGLTRLLSRHTVRATKDGPLVSPVAYRPGTTRGKDNVLEVAALSFDVDGVEPDWDLLDGVAFIAYTTYSHRLVCAHNPTGGPCWRLILQLDWPVERDDWERVWQRARARYAPTSDPSCSDASRMYYLPSHPPGATPEVRIGDGAPVAPDLLPEAPEEVQERELAAARASAPSPPSVRPAGEERPGDRFNRESTWAELLEPRGWRSPGERGGCELWNRPGRATDREARSANTTPDGNLYVWTSNAPPFEARRSYTKLAAYVLLEHGGDWRAGIRALAERYDPPPAIDLGDVGARTNGHAPPPAPPNGGGGSGDDGAPPAAGPPRPKAKGPKDAGLVVATAQRILSQSRFAQDEGGGLYRYAAGAYHPRAERFVKGRVKAVLEASGKLDAWTSHVASEVVEFIAVDAPLLWERPPADVVNLANGLLELRPRTLRPHTPDHRSPVQFSVAYDPAAGCPAWEAFLEPILPRDMLDAGVVWELVADLLQPGTRASVQKAILAIGEGENGKSTFLDALGLFLGRRNLSGVSLHRLESDRFSGARLVGKLANICPDLPSARLTGTSVFKAIVDGSGDPISAEQKYQNAYDYWPFCRLVFSANTFPQSEDNTHAFFRRWLVYPFPYTFAPGDPRKRDRAELMAELGAPGELSGVLNKALAHYPALRAHGFTETESMRAAWDEFRATTDPIVVWLTRHTQRGHQLRVAKGTLLDAYNASLTGTGQSNVSGTAFGIALKRWWPQWKHCQRTINGESGTWCWDGLGLVATHTPGGAP